MIKFLIILHHCLGGRATAGPSQPYMMWTRGTCKHLPIFSFISSNHRSAAFSGGLAGRTAGFLFIQMCYWIVHSSCRRALSTLKWYSFKVGIFNLIYAVKLLIIFQILFKGAFHFLFQPLLYRFVRLPRVNDPPSPYIHGNPKFHPFLKMPLERLMVVTSLALVQRRSEHWLGIAKAW